MMIKPLKLFQGLTLLFLPAVWITNARDIYIYKGEILSVCLSVCLSVTLLIRLGLSTSPYQLPNIKNPSSSSFKFVTAVISLRSTAA